MCYKQKCKVVSHNLAHPVYANKDYFLMALPGVEKHFISTIGLAVWTQYRTVAERRQRIVIHAHRAVNCILATNSIS